MWIFPILRLVVIAAIAVALVKVASYPDTAVADDPAQPSAELVEPQLPVSLGTITKDVVVPGTVNADAAVPVRATAIGTVDEVFATVGRSVANGDKLYDIKVETPRDPVRGGGMTLLHLEGVTRTVRLIDAPPLTILSGVDLDVAVGDRVSIVGRSGSGKSTLLNLLGLLDNPTTGVMLFDDRPVRSFSGGQRDRVRGRDVGFIFQQFNLLQGRTALENVMTPLLYAECRQIWRRARIAAEMLDRVGLGHHPRCPSGQTLRR